MALTFTHRRAEWLQGDKWLSAPAFPAWSAIDLAIVHYPGGNAPDGDPGDSTDIARYIANNQRSYLAHKKPPFNLGYNVAIDWRGETWEIRGDQYRNAANAPAALNARSISFLVITDLDGMTTPAADEAVRDLLAQVRRHSPGVKLIGHRDGRKYYSNATATACPSDRIHALIHAGHFEPRPAPAPQPPEDDVNWNLPANVRATVKSNPPVAETLTGKWNDWAVCALIKSLQALTGLPVTGQLDQRTGEQVNAELAKRGIRL